MTDKEKLSVMTNEVALAVSSPSNSLAVSGEVRRLVMASRSANTQRAYRSDLKAFSAWCRASNRSELPASPETLAEYVGFLTRTCKPATISRRLAAISVAHKAAGLESPTLSELVRSTIKGARRELGTMQTKKAAVRIAGIRLAVKEFDLSPKSVRDRALLLVGYAGAFRRSELVGLELQDLAFTSEGVRVTVRRSKTDQEGAGMVKGIPFGSREDTCPVRALRAWLELAGIESGPVFRSVTKGGKVQGSPLGDRDVSRILKGLAGALGLEPDQVGGHSLRSGLITDAYASGVPEAVIMATSGHKSHRVMSGYRREANLFAQNAAASVGL